MEKKIFKPIQFFSGLWIYAAIYIMTTVDMALTYFGIMQGIIEEANPLMKLFFYANPTYTVIGFLVGTAIVMYFFYSVKEQVKWLFSALIIIMAVKLLILAMHFYWIINYLYYY